jgi:hypothetical protein
MLRLPCVTLRTNSSNFGARSSLAIRSFSQQREHLLLCRDFVVGIATSYGLEGPRLNPGGWRDFFSLLHYRSDRPWGPPRFTYNAYRASFPWIKRSERGTDHSLSSTARVKNDCSYTLPSPLCLNGTVLGDLHFLHLFLSNYFRK